MYHRRLFRRNLRFLETFDLAKELRIMSENFSHLSESFDTLTAEDERLISLVSKLSDEIHANADDEDAMHALADKVDAEVARIKGVDGGGQAPQDAPTEPTPSGA